MNRTKSHKMPDKFKAYKLEEDENIGLNFAKHAVIGRFEDVCFIGSNVLAQSTIIDERGDIWPFYVIYNHKFMKTDVYPSL